MHTGMIITEGGLLTILVDQHRVISSEQLLSLIVSLSGHTEPLSCGGGTPDKVDELTVGSWSRNDVACCQRWTRCIIFLLYFFSVIPETRSGS